MLECNDEDVQACLGSQRGLFWALGPYSLVQTNQPAESLLRWRDHRQTEVSVTTSFPSQYNLLFMAFQPHFSPGDGIFSPQQSEKNSFCSVLKCCAKIQTSAIPRVHCFVILS